MSEIDMNTFKLAIEVVFNKRKPEGLSLDEVEDLFFYHDGEFKPSPSTVDGQEIYEAAEQVIGEAFRSGLNGYGSPFSQMMQHAVKMGIFKLR